MFATLGYYICVPFAFLTRLFYSWTGSYGVALILFTLVVKLVLLPFQLKSKKSMLRMNRMQGKLNDIKTRYANNQQKQQEAMAELYAKEGINPMSGCLWSFIPFPILIALYYIIRVPMRYFMGLSETVIAEITTLAGSLGFTVADGSQAYEQIYLAKFIHEHWAEFAGKFDGLIELNYSFLHIDLANRPSDLFSQFPGGGWPVWGAILLPIISAGIQFAMSFITMRTNGSAPNGSTKTMMYMMPLLDCQLRVLPDPGGHPERVFQQDSGPRGDGEGEGRPGKALCQVSAPEGADGPAAAGQRRQEAPESAGEEKALRRQEKIHRKQRKRPHGPASLCQGPRL